MKDYSPNDLRPIPIPKGKRAISVLLSYLGIVIIIAFLFLPILGVKETEEVGGKIFTISAACSPFQFITQDTYAEVQVYGGSKEENEFLESLVGRIDIADDSIGGVFPFDLYKEDNLFFSIVATVVLLIIYIPVPIAMTKVILANQNAIPKRLANETDDAFKKRIIQIMGNKEYTRFAHLKTPLILLSVIGYPVVITIGLCVLSFAMRSSDLFDYRTDIDMLRLIIAAVIMLGSATILTSGLLTIKENRILLNNYVYDSDNEVFRPRTPQETEKLFTICGIKTNESTIPFYKSQNNTNSITTQTGQTMTEESRIKLLKEYKALLDGGVISTAEYEAKKQELLGSYNKDK